MFYSIKILLKGILKFKEPVEFGLGRANAFNTHFFGKAWVKTIIKK